MLAVVFTVDDEAGMGRRRIGNKQVLAAAQANPDVLIPFGSVDPHKVLAERPRLVSAVRGDRLGGPDCAVPFGHDRHRRWDAGRRWGRLKYADPMCVDDVAPDFPELDIILAHPSFPWQDEGLAIAVHKPNVFIDLSGWSRKYFPENLVR